MKKYERTFPGLCATDGERMEFTNEKYTVPGRVNPPWISRDNWLNTENINHLNPNLYLVKA